MGFIYCQLLSEHATPKWTGINSWRVTRCATVFLRLATLGVAPFSVGIASERSESATGPELPTKHRYFRERVQRSSIATKKWCFSLGIEACSWLRFHHSYRREYTEDSAAGEYGGINGHSVFSVLPLLSNFIPLYRAIRA